MLPEFKEGSVVQVSGRMKASADDGSSRVFLNAAEVGEQLGLRKSRVFERAAQGLLPNVRLGRRILFPIRGLDAHADLAIQESRNRVLGLDADPLRTH
jgi:hypothetical protein